MLTFNVNFKQNFYGEFTVMDDIQKFYSDIEKIKKHERADNGGNYDGLRVCNTICDFFEKNNSSLAGLGTSFAGYWMDTYINSSEKMEEEPTAEHIDKLAAMQSLLEGSTDYTECLTQDDWKELCSLTNYEAEDLPIEILNDLMIIFVDKKAL